MQHALASFEACLFIDGECVSSKSVWDKLAIDVDVVVEAHPIVVNLVIQNRNLEYGEQRCGFDTKNHSIKAAVRALLASGTWRLMGGLARRNLLVKLDTLYRGAR
jgi:hypothetical protein